ncbi:hypothetical protein CL617_01460 [archaeon]|nr:hypothetical protein [archaeon]|tara:strand:+ start:9585 stop:9902 length:318 start_codon:yes stop_codon:yes gene_type:complete
MTYSIFHSQTFDQELNKFPKDFKEWVTKIEEQLNESPYVGDQIRVKWLREKKRGKYRIYYLIYDDIKSVYMIGISGKKDQQAVINSIWLLIDQFKDEIKNLIKKK